MTEVLSKIDPALDTHKFHLIKVEKETENYTEDGVGVSYIRTRVRSPRYAVFICEGCGLIRKVEVQ